MKIVDFSVDRRVTTTMLILICVVAGLISLKDLGLDMLPEIEIPIVSVVTSYSGASPADIESTVTKPVEKSVASVSGVSKVTSSSMEGVSLVMVEFDSGTNLDFAAQDLRDQLAIFEDIFPDAVEVPLVVKFDISQIPVLFYGITSEKRAGWELARYVEDNIVYRLERLDGIASVIVQSPELREILVEIDRSALQTSGLDLARIIRALRLENLNLPAGRIVEDHKDFLIRTRAEFRSLDEIRTLVIGLSPSGAPIRLAQVAQVKDTAADTRLKARIMGKSGVVMFITKGSGANTVQAAENVKAEIARLQSSLPKDIELHVGMDQSRPIELMVRSTTIAAALGGLLAMLMIYLFLRNIRPTLAVAVAIPLSILVTFIPLRLAGYTLNVFTLGGLALGVGMLVDNAIVVIENVFRHLEEGKTRVQAAKEGAAEVGLAVTASTATTLAVFLPMSLGKGIAGDLARGLSLSISFALLASLFVSLTMVPMLASVFFKERSKDEYRAAFGEVQFDRFKAAYRRLLEKALHRRWTVMTLVGLAFAGSLGLIPLVGTEFLPAQDQGMMMMKIILPTGSPLEETDRAVRRIEELMLREPGVLTVIASVGVNENQRQDSAGGFGNKGSHEGLLMARLAEVGDRDLSSTEIIEKMRISMPKMRGTKLESVDMTGGAGAGGDAVEIKVLGLDFAVLKRLSQEVLARIQDVEGLRDLKTSLEDARPEYQVILNREEVNRMGLSSGQIASVLEASTLGTVATRYRFAGQEIDVRVRFAKADRQTLRDIQMIPINTPMHTQVPLMQLARLEKVEGPVNIMRDNQTRVVQVTANLVDRDLGSVFEDIKARLADLESRLPEGYFIEYGGQYKQMIETFITLGQALALALLLVYMVMASQFESLRHPFVIMFTIPLALIGVVLGFLVSGQTISLPSFIGFIMLTGIVVNNAIVLVDYVNQLRANGMGVQDAILRSGEVRLRPVLITALTTIMGMVPMAVSSSEGSEFRIPMAITVMGGLAFSTLLTLVVVPVVYSLMAGKDIKAEGATKAG